MAIPWEGVGLLLAGLVGGLTKSCYNGIIRKTVIDPLLTKRRTAKEAHGAIPEVVETIERVEGKVDRIDGKVEAGMDTVESQLTDLNETVAYLHREELREDPLARDRLDVEADNDFLRGGD